jgi:hypothetical protein
VGEKVTAEKTALSVLDSMDRWVDYAGHHARRRLLKFAGVPQEHCGHYADVVWAGNSLVIALGSADEVIAAKDVLQWTEPGELRVYAGVIPKTDGISERPRIANPSAAYLPIHRQRGSRHDHKENGSTGH